MFGINKPAKRPNAAELRQRLIERIDSALADFAELHDRDVADILQSRANALRMRIAMTTAIV